MAGLPWIKVATDFALNLQVLCMACNVAKGTKSS